MSGNGKLADVNFWMPQSVWVVLHMARPPGHLNNKYHLTQNHAPRLQKHELEILAQAAHAHTLFAAFILTRWIWNFIFFF